MPKMTSSEEEFQIKKLAGQVLSLARDNILVHARFLSAALMNLQFAEAGSTGSAAADGAFFRYDGRFLLQQYQREPA